MDKEIVEHFLGKFVQLSRRSKGQVYKLYGEIKQVTDDSILIQTDMLGAVLLEDIVSIRETKKRDKDA